MKIRKRHPLKSAVGFAGIFLLLVQATNVAEQGSKQAASERRITFAGEAPSVGAIRMTIEFYGMGQLRPSARVREWGSGLPVDLAIRKIQLWVRGTHVKVPANAYASLLNVIPSTVEFRKKGQALSLYMKGGDGAEAYQTRIEIIGGAPKERETVGGEFKYPQSPYERITFRSDGTSSYWLTKEMPKNLSKAAGAVINLRRE